MGHLLQPHPRALKSGSDNYLQCPSILNVHNEKVYNNDPSLIYTFHDLFKIVLALLQKAWSIFLHLDIYKWITSFSTPILMHL